MFPTSPSKVEFSDSPTGHVVSFRNILLWSGVRSPRSMNAERRWRSLERGPQRCDVLIPQVHSSYFLLNFARLLLFFWACKSPISHNSTPVNSLANEASRRKRQCFTATRWNLTFACPWSTNWLVFLNICHPPGECCWACWAWTSRQVL